MNRTVLSLAVVVAFSALVLACGGDDATAPAPPAESVTTAVQPSEPSATEAPVTEAPATEAPVTEAPVTDAPATEAPAPPESPAAGDCPIGTWQISTEALQGFYDQIGASTGVEFVVQGGARLVLTDEGTFEYQFQDYGLAQSVAGTETVVTISGTIGGTYTADGTRFATTITAPEVTASASVNGMTIDASSILQGILADFPLTNATYRCEGADLEVDFRVLDGTTPIRMVPA